MNKRRYKKRFKKDIGEIITKLKINLLVPFISLNMEKMEILLEGKIKNEKKKG